MARSFTRAQLRTRLEQLTDTENDPHLSTAEKDSIINSAIAETWDVICGSGLGENFVKKVSFNTVSGQTEYDFATIVPAGDFYRIYTVYADEGNSQYRALTRIGPAEILNYRAPTMAVPMVLSYIPCAPIISSDSTSFDGINGWEEHTLMTAAIAVKMKKQDSYQPYAQRKAELEKRMREMGDVDFGQVQRVQRRRKPTGSLYYPYFSQVNTYVVRGGKLELYYAYPWVR